MYGVWRPVNGPASLDAGRNSKPGHHPLRSRKGYQFYDTAIAYQNGSSERYVGRALREMAKREDVVLATKFLPRTAEQIAAGSAEKRQ